MADVLELI